MNLGILFLFQGTSYAAGQTTLSFSQATPVVGNTFTVDVLINSGQDTILNTDLSIQFDPTKLQAISIIPGPFLPGATEITSVKKIDNTKGVIVESFYTTKNNAAKGTGIFATITFKALTLGTTIVSFDTQRTVVPALGIDNAIQNVQPASYTIQATAANTPVPTSSGQSVPLTPVSTNTVPSTTVPLSSNSADASGSATVDDTSFFGVIGETLTSLFGAKPTPIPAIGFGNGDGNTCTITEARWLSPNRVVTEETRVLLMIRGNGACIGKQVSFEVREDDGFKVDSVVVNPMPGIFQNNGIAYATWTTEYQEDIFNLVALNTIPEYYFRVGVSGQGDPIASQGFELQVVQKSQASSAGN